MLYELTTRTNRSLCKVTVTDHKRNDVKLDLGILGGDYLEAHGSLVSHHGVLARPSIFFYNLSTV